MTDPDQSQMILEPDPSQRENESNENQQGLTDESNRGKMNCCKRNLVIIIIIVVICAVSICEITLIVIESRDRGYVEPGPFASMEDFDAFALDKAAKNTTNNNTIYYDLRLNNHIDYNNVHDRIYSGIYYDALNITFYYYKPNISLLIPIGNATFPPFYQGIFSDKLKHSGSIEPIGAFWEDATKTVVENGSAVFRVELVTAYNYKIMYRKSDKHLSMVVGADLHVDDHGRLIKSKIFHHGVVLTSDAGKSKGSLGLWGILGVLLCF